MALTNAGPRSAAPDVGILALLDAIPDATAMLDRDCTIVAVNHAWRMFAVDNGGDPQSTGIGVSYLAVCERSAAAGSADAAAVAIGLRAVLQGETVEAEFEYACPSPAVGRWYALRITAIGVPRVGLLVSHLNISRRKLAEGDLLRRASEDPLTRLANRERFLERMTLALTAHAGRPLTPDLGVIYLDLDSFKPVNDTYGHAAGDDVLQTVAARLAAVTRPQDTIARLGGDEFAVLAPQITLDGLAGLVTRMTDALNEPHVVHGDSVTVGASVGSYLASPGETAAECLHRADTAMYDLKRGHRKPPRA
ncbi:diguanylate cyclase domain-containing protein [Pengzhenrongella phosphoraccumulans]|uniref:diguanylate cyclase domain-containing protein n=1 Tax=Pengzhenrongella phosphoraccumulans TaxID=3114394 RepID=UPI00388FC764